LTSPIAGSIIMHKKHLRHSKAKESKAYTVKPMLKRTKAKIQNHRLFNGVFLAIFSFVFIAVGVYFIINSFAASPTIPPTFANVFVASNGSDTGTNCKLFTTAVQTPDSNGATLCKSFEKAVSLVQNGGTVLVKSGTYGAQTITSDRTSTTYVVAQSGTTIGGFTPDSNWVEYQNFTAANLNMQDINAQNVTLRNVSIATQGAITVDGPDHFHWIGGNIGAYSQDLSDWPGRFQIQGCNPNCGDSPTTDLLFEDLTIEPVVITANCIAHSTDCHREIFRFNQGVSDVKIRNNTFKSGSRINSAVIFFGEVGNASIETNILIENNFFGKALDSQPIVDGNSQGAACGAWTIAYNTNTSGNGLWGGDATNCSSQSSVKITGNLGNLNDSSKCGNAVYDHNVWTNPTGCGGGDIANQSISFTGDGFHIPSNSPAIGRGSSTYCPATDHDGGARPNPSGGVCDAGAHEYGSTPSGDTSAPSVSITYPDGGTVGGTTGISAIASDNVGVVGVQFKVDGNAVGTEDTTSPYSINWDSASVANGSHTLTAVARDAAGNSTTSASMVITVSNTPPKPGDTNGDDLVNITDLSTLLSHYSANFPNADFNKDNIVNITDLSILLSNYGK
jgi:hypothetical protein